MSRAPRYQSVEGTPVASEMHFRGYVADAKAEGADVEAAAPAAAPAATLEPADDYLKKLAKFVPVEGLAPALAFAAFAEDDKTMLALILGISLIVGLALLVVQTQSETPKPRWWFWLFSMIAFVAWSLGASPGFRHLFGDVGAKDGALILGLTAFALPAIDGAIIALTKKKG